MNDFTDRYENISENRKVTTAAVTKNLQSTERMFPLTQADLDNATRLRVNPKTGHILITKDDPQDLQDWALNG
jgi:hypothetical protein